MSDKAKLTDFLPDPHNANRGTERGVYMVEESLQRNGAGRSIVVSADDVVLAGNKTLQAAIDAGMIEARVVETDGHELVVVKRTDLQYGTPEAVNLAIADNRAGEVGLEWDAAMLDALDELTDLNTWFWEDELEDIHIKDELLDGIDRALSSDPDNAREQLNSKDKIIRPVISVETLEAFERAMKKTGKANREEALLEVCESYLDESFPL